MSKAVVCFSGGMDSATALYWARENFDVILALGVSYGGKHNRRERLCARAICDRANVLFYTYDLPPECEVQLGFIDNGPELPPTIGTQLTPFLQSDLLESGGPIPYGHYAEESMKKTVVPFRNGIILSLATGFAESVGAQAVILGNHAGDHAVYPDCRPEFISYFLQAARCGTFNGVELVSPFCGMSKADIVRLGLELGVPFELTWSCYEGHNRPCLRCGTDVERTEAFFLANIQDPALTDEEWKLAVEVATKACNEKRNTSF